jgi:hypothetical protein
MSNNGQTNNATSVRGVAEHRRSTVAHTAAASWYWLTVVCEGTIMVFGIVNDILEYLYVVLQQRYRESES